MTRPLLLDLFCGAGGAAMGYSHAGFDVVGVDIKPQPHYPFEFVLGDALTFPLEGFDVIHASPPCQAYSTTRTLHGSWYPSLIPAVRERLAGRIYVIENVIGSGLPGARVCGSALGLEVRRHRLFESSVWLFGTPCAHGWQPRPIDVTGGGPSVAVRMDGKGGRSRKPKDLAEASRAMGIEWMSRDELNEAIPPAYTEFIGAQLLEQMARAS